MTAAIVNGELRALEYLKKGDEITCEECGERLILKDSHAKKKRKHLAHHGSSECPHRKINEDKRGGEGPMHYFAKERVCQLFNDLEIKRLTVVQKLCNCPAKEIDLMQFRTADNIISTEVWDGVFKKRYDVAIRNKTTREVIYIIEVLRTHRTDEADRNHPWCELSAEKIHQVDIFTYDCQRTPALTCNHCLSEIEAARIEREERRKAMVESNRIHAAKEAERLEAERIKRQETERLNQLEAERQKADEIQKSMAVFKIRQIRAAEKREWFWEKQKADWIRLAAEKVELKAKQEADRIHAEEKAKHKQQMEINLAHYMRIKNIDAIKRAKFQKIYDKEQRCIKAEEDGKIERIQNDAAREKMRALKETEKQAKRQINCPMCKTHACITFRIKIQRLCK
jgi:DNA-directed RNA polymerase subunit RPC12/RpoP